MSGAPASRERLRLAGAAYIAGAPQFIGNVAPLLLGGIAEQFAASPVQLGFINSCYSGASMALALSAPWWVRRVGGPLLAFAAAATATTLFMFAGHAADLRYMYGLFFTAGVLSGLMGAPAIALIGFSKEPARWYGVSMLFQMIAAAAFALVVPAVLQPRFGSSVLFAAMAAMYLPCLLSAPMLGRLAPQASAHADRAAGDLAAPVRGAPDSGASASRLFASFAGCTLFAIGGVAFWIFLERMGHAAGIAPSLIGLTVAVGAAAAAVAATLVAAFATRLRVILVVGVCVGLAGFLTMLVPSPAAFLASACLFNLSWGSAIPAFQAAMRKADVSGRFFVAGTGTIFVAAVIAGPLAGSVARYFDYGGVVVLSICASAASLALGWYALGGPKGQEATPIDTLEIRH